MSLVNEQWLFLQDFARLIQFAAQKNMLLTGGELSRTTDQQRIYISQGKSKTMDSRHIKRVAVDLNIIIDGQLCNDWNVYKILGDYWESLNPKNTWGGDWNKDNLKNGFIDSPHFERSV